ncbi:SDR family NAD(P)-dependent oxidoreductase [Halorubrum salsamenti]|jgi:NAD(P)-dependent dehydrogenase (short-subunit alcohol dehydrogenase family)|uniref:SDR family NAD(P)-dependent oxidoreductase n=1 Tax=Halorubrum salsamenti TaxID=2583990 RepID=UPI0016423EDF|nr:SDR family NAD(P)-dependent oxidoreductase [Halorubrum salsamenti]
MNLDTQTAIVTGGASGIGAATCRVLAERGADVVVADLSVDEGERLAESITEDGGHASFVETDVSDEDAIAHMVDHAESMFGRVDILVNNAAVASRDADGPITEFSDDAYEFLTGVNLQGPMYACKHAIPAMLETGDGSGVIINNASIAALIAEPGMDIYTATKGAIVSLTRSIAVEYAPAIRANTICPGIVETPMLEDVLEADSDGDVPDVTEEMINKTPLGMAAPEDIGRAIAFLASEDAAFVTGATIPVDGGYTAR